MYFSILISGFAGGAIRGLIGFIKHQFSYKNVGFKMNYFLCMVFLSGVIGVLTVGAIKEIGFTFNDTFSPALSLIIGYAGGDILENIYKIILNKSSLYQK